MCSRLATDRQPLSEILARHQNQKQRHRLRVSTPESARLDGQPERPFQAALLHPLGAVVVAQPGLRSGQAARLSVNLERAHVFEPEETGANLTLDRPRAAVA